MDRIASYFDRRYRQHSIARGLKNLGFLFWGKARRFVGLILEDEVIVLDFKHFSSCRIRVSNLLNVPYSIEYMEPLVTPYSVEYMKLYFKENQDNPYGVWNYSRALMLEPRPEKLTQYPPLYYPKDNFGESIDRIRELAKPADTLFSYNRRSGLSRMIRVSDKGMWSHVGMVSERGTIYESTTSGIAESDFSDFEPGTDVALYRIPNITDEQREKMNAWLKSQVGREGYNWRGVIRIYLHQRWGIPYKRRPNELTPADLMYANRYELVAYA